MHRMRTAPAVVSSVLAVVLMSGCSAGTGQSSPAPTTTRALPSSAASTSTTPTTAAPTSTPQSGTPGGKGANGGTGGSGSEAVGVTGASAGGHSSPSAAGCTPDGTGVPAGVVHNQTVDVDGDGKPDTEWMQPEAGGRFLLGITTASGSTFGAYFASASPVARSMFVADATGHGQIVVLASDGRQVALFRIANCRMSPVLNIHGKQYTFDLGFTGYGTGVGCSQIAGTSGRELVGLKLNTDSHGTPVSVDRTAVEIHNTTATNGRSDSINVNGRSKSDPAVATASEVTCGARTLHNNGLQSQTH